MKIHPTDDVVVVETEFARTRRVVAVVETAGNFYFYFFIFSTRPLPKIKTFRVTTKFSTSSPYQAFRT